MIHYSIKTDTITGDIQGNFNKARNEWNKIIKTPKWEKSPNHPNRVTFEGVEKKTANTYEKKIIKLHVKKRNRNGGAGLTMTDIL